MMIHVIASFPGRELQKRSLDEVHAFYASDKYVICVFEDGEKWFVTSLVNETHDPADSDHLDSKAISLVKIHAFLLQHDELRYSRCHKGTLADLLQAKRLGKTPDDSSFRSPFSLTLKNGVDLPVSRRFIGKARKVFREGVAA